LFRGQHSISIDNKGRLAVPSRYRLHLSKQTTSQMVLTLSPFDRALWLYPLPEWEIIETKLSALSEFDKQSRRTRQMMRSAATDCQLDSQGRILIPKDLRDYAELMKNIVVFGQGNKFEIWNESYWNEERQSWLQSILEDEQEPAEALRTLSL